MEKKKTIILRNPHIRRFRKYLREIIVQSVLSKEIQLKKNGKLQEKKELEEILSKSICQCARCGRLDKDMTFNLPLKSWYCIDCVKVFIEFYKYKMDKTHGRNVGDFHKEFYKGFLNKNSV